MSVLDLNLFWNYRGYQSDGEVPFQWAESTDLVQAESKAGFAPC